MTIPEQNKGLKLLSEQRFTVISEKESIDFYLNEIRWNVRSLMRQADMLETAISEMKNSNAKLF